MVISEAISVREQFVSNGGKGGQLKFGSSVQNFFHQTVLMSLASIPNFPHTPWQSLSDNEKQFLLRTVMSLPFTAFYAQTATNPPLGFAEFVKNEPGTKTLENYIQQCKERLPYVPDNEPVKFGFFRINLKYERSVLIEAFKMQLRILEGKPMLEFPPVAPKVVKKSVGRKSIKDKLNALGALRLRYHCNTLKEAQKMLPQKDHPRTKNKRVPIFLYRTSYERACIKAVNHFKKLYGLIDSENPIHFTTGWRKGDS